MLQRHSEPLPDAGPSWVLRLLLRVKRLELCYPLDHHARTLFLHVRK